jgi:hypothetical protein
MKHLEPDDPTRCAACGARDRSLQLPTVPDPTRPYMRICVDHGPCLDRWTKRGVPERADRV